MRYAWITDQGESFPLSEMCDALAVSVSGYRAWKRGGVLDRTRLLEPQIGYKVTTVSKHGLPVADNLLVRNFAPTAPNRAWTSDITYLWPD